VVSLLIKREFCASVKRRMGDENYFTSPSPLFPIQLMVLPAFFNLLSRRRKQQVPSKHWYTSTKLQSVSAIGMSSSLSIQVYLNNTEI
jgi:hypothetical protein